jgi:uncharacterized protein (DUF58 family)
MKWSNSSNGTDLPISIDALSRFYLEANRRMPSAGFGAYLRRRLGQSLEFREHRNYVFGDDVRAVDWAASQRVGGPSDWVVRTFEAEERLTIAISVDTRPSMYLPLDPAEQNLSGGEKIRVAGWIACALAEMAAFEKDQVLLHRLFVPENADRRRPEICDPYSAREFARTLLNEAPGEEAEWQAPFALNDKVLLTALPPASLLIILSDLYFDGNDDQFRRMLIEAQRDYREVVVVRFDSWPVERTILERGTTRIHPVEGIYMEDGLVDVDERYMESVSFRIEKHIHNLLEGTQAGGLVEGIWQWPESFENLNLAVRGGFEAQFLGFSGFQSIFTRLT